jgi:hypothetical protein
MLKASICSLGSVAIPCDDRAPTSAAVRAGICALDNETVCIDDSAAICGRAWKFAEILAKATDVLGTQAEAEQWLERPAIGLDQRRPIDLLGTPAGVELVEDYLERLEYGVYA